MSPCINSINMISDLFDGTIVTLVMCHIFLFVFMPVNLLFNIRLVSLALLSTRHIYFTMNTI